MASTDMANVSLAVPSIHPMLDIDSSPAVNHQPEFAAAAITPAADRAVRDGALAMAWTIVDLATRRGPAFAARRLGGLNLGSADRRGADRAVPTDARRCRFALARPERPFLS